MDNLKGNTKRQAVPVIKGYAYQIWQSLLKWLELKEDEHIFLEGAEDIDLLRNDSAETIQVKCTSSQITLGLKGTAEVLNNYWESKRKNPQLRIKYRYLTTSERGHEQGDPFGGKKGLDVWDSCKFPGTDLSRLRSFLKSSANFSPELQDFIDKASDNDLRNELIIPVEWDTGTHSLEIIEDLVEDKIVNYGDRIYDLPPHSSKQAIPHLLKHVWDVVCKSEDRWLRYRDFLELFEKSTMELVPRKELRELNRTPGTPSAAGTMFGFGKFPTGSAVGISTDLFLERFNPPDMTHFAEREEIINDLRERLNDAGFLTLIGSTGMGKSILSYQLAEHTEGNWRKLDLRGNSPEQINEKLLFATGLIGSNSERIDLVIDDLNFDNRPDIYENALVRLIYLLKYRNGRGVITSHHRLPARVEAALNVKDESSFPVPRMNEAEIKKLLVKYECPSGHKLKYWTKVINRKTQGHPTLCHAWVRKSEADGWKELDAEALIFDAPIADIKEEFRRTISQQLADETRLLLYRLTIFIGRFKRKQALAVGRLDPVLRFPGEEFDRLIGPWIEPVGNDYFRVSPLVYDIEKDHLTKEEIKELHKAAALSFLSETIGYIELDGLLWHGFFAEEDKCLVAAITCLNRVDKATLTTIYQYIDWFASFNVENGKKLYPKNDLLNYLLRQLQFEINSELKPEKAVKIAEIIEREFDLWDESEDKVSTKPMMVLTFLTKTLLDINVPFPVKQAFDRTLQLIALQENNLLFPDHPEYQREFENKAQRLLDPRYFVYPLPARCRTPEAVIELLTLMEESGIPDSHPIRRLFKTDNYIVGMLVDDIWLHEVKKDVPDWGKSLDSLDWVIQYSLKNNIETVGAAAYIGKAIVFQEYLNNTERALQTLDEGEGLFGQAKLFLQDYRAKVFFFQKDYESAFNLWKTILPQISADLNSARGTSFREAEICAARLGKWNEASKFALMGERAFRLNWFQNFNTEEWDNSPINLVTLQYRADYAFAQWKAGNKETAVLEFFKVIKGFETLPDPREDIKVNLFYKRVGHTVGWMSGETRPPQNISIEEMLYEPPVGCFTNPEINDEIKTQIAELPVQSIINLKFLLAGLEYRLGTGNEIFKDFEKEIADFGGLDANIGFLNLSLKHSLRELRDENLIDQVMNYAAALADYLKAIEHKTPDFDFEELLKPFILAAVLIAVREEKLYLLDLNKWKNDLGRYFAESAAIFNFIDYIEETTNALTVDLVEWLRNNLENPDKRLLAAIMLSNAKILDPDTRFYSNVMLVTSRVLAGVRDETGDCIAEIVSESWVNVIKTQRFYINNPNHYAPKILSACNDRSTGGVAKAARIVLEARNAVSVYLDKDILSSLQELSSNNF